MYVKMCSVYLKSFKLVLGFGSCSLVRACQSCNYPVCHWLKGRVPLQVSKSRTRLAMLNYLAFILSLYLLLHSALCLFSSLLSLSLSFFFSLLCIVERVVCTGSKQTVELPLLQLAFGCGLL